MGGGTVLVADAAAHGVFAGAVLLDPPGSAPDATPWLRTVRVVPVAGFDEAATLLSGARGPLRGWQGMAIAGDLPAAASERLVMASGVSRVADAGSLQDADATWDDGEAV